MIKRLFQIVTAIAGGIAIAVPSMAPANDNVTALSKNPGNWAMWGGTYDRFRYSPLAQINKDNVGDLQVARLSIPSTGVLREHKGGPLVIDNAMFIHTPFSNKVFSINLADQSINWSYVPEQDGAATIPVMCNDTVYRGLAYADGKIFLQQADTTLVALDANTGKRLW